LTRALTMAREVGNPPQLWKTYQALGALYESQADLERAQAAYQSALDVIDGVAERLQDQALQGTFLAARPVQSIRAHPPLADRRREWKAQDTDRADVCRGRSSLVSSARGTAVLVLDLPDSNAAPWDTRVNGGPCSCCAARCCRSGMAGKRCVYDTAPTRQRLAEEAEPAHSC